MPGHSCLDAQCCSIWECQDLSGSAICQHRGAPCWPQLLCRALQYTGPRNAGPSTVYTCMRLISPCTLGSPPWERAFLCTVKYK